MKIRYILLIFFSVLAVACSSDGGGGDSGSGNNGGGNNGGGNNGGGNNGGGNNNSTETTDPTGGKRWFERATAVASKSAGQIA